MCEAREDSGGKKSEETGWGGVRMGLCGSRADGKRTVRSTPSISSIEKPEINIMFCMLRVLARVTVTLACVCVYLHPLS